MSSDMPTLYREATEAEASDYHSNQLATIVGVPVERCEHGNIDPHLIVLPQPGWCPGSPTLRGADDE